MRRAILVLSLVLAAPARADEVEAPSRTAAWRVDCAATSVITDGRVTRASACSADFTGQDGADIRLWTETRDAGQLVRRPPAVTIEFAVPADRLQMLRGNFASRASLITASAVFHVTFNDRDPIEGRCESLSVPPRPAAPGPASPRPLDFDRIGCRIADAEGLLRRLLLDTRSFATALTIGDAHLTGRFVLDTGGEAAFDAAMARLAGTGVVAVPAPATAPSRPGEPPTVEYNIDSFDGSATAPPALPPPGNSR
ncbi:MAG: hypothetical protein PHS60_12735 [Zavarzinia sp.]|nr:hypothetical protein [Zavarzinia sp.]